MKKNYVIMCLGILFSGSMLHAQLNGVYTIDNTAPSSATNFTSFTQFASTLNAQGVNGAVTVNVGGTSGPYNEQIEIMQYTGASATNSVVINGNGRTITFNATNAAQRHTIMLSGADYMTWNNLRVYGTNATNALSFHLWNGSNNNTFNSMYFEAPVNGNQTTQVPFSISGSSSVALSTGTAGSFNIVNTSTVMGGYYGAVFYGNASAPISTGNEIRSSVVRDFFNCGVYNVYSQNSRILNNLMDRVNRTSITTTYGVLLTTGTTGALVEGNHIREVFTNNLGGTNAAYLIYCSGAGTSPSAPNLIRNNVVSDINSNGTIIGIYMVSSDHNYAEHNTISIDYASATSGTSYGIYSTSGSSRVRNNNISINRAGTGSKWGLYYTTAATNMVSDYNNVTIGTTTTTYGYGYYGTTTYTTLANWQAGTGFDIHSINEDPQYSNPAAFNYAPTNLAVNNKGLPIGVLTDILGASRSPLAPDPGAYEIFNTPCVSAPPSNSFIVPSGSLCPGLPFELVLQHTSTYTNSGYVVQWYSSQTMIGGYSAIPGATLNSVVSSLVNTSLYFQAVVTCTNNNTSNTTPPGLVMISPIIQDTVPYFESFETIAQNGLPNCYWAESSYNDKTEVSSGAKSQSRVARTGTNYAYFRNNPLPNYFYTNQILLKAGITYSAALWYITETVGYNQWESLSIMIDTVQGPAGLQPIATASPVTGQLYNALSNTFTVKSTKYYYVAVRAVGAYTAAPYLTWDDLSITIPCSHNSPILSVVAPINPVCQNMPVGLLAGGADTYSWSNGTQGASNVVVPVTHSTYIVYGLNSNAGCTSSVAINLTVTPSPILGAIASDYSVCSGQSTTLTATGADFYYWSTGANSSVTVVNPTISSTYNVAGTNTAGCTGSTQVQVAVYPTPVIIAKPSSTLICRGDAVQLTVTGADSYVWLAPNLYSTASVLTVTLQTSTMYTVTATTQNGCSVTSQVFVVADACTGLASSTRSDLKIFPNPATNELFIQTDGDDVAVTITDVAGRVITTQRTTGALTTIDLRTFSAGVYYVRLQANDYNRVEKIIKH